MREYPSILDNDLYKFTMMQAVYHQFPDVHVEYKLVNRGPEDLWQDHERLIKAIDNLQGVGFQEGELMYLKSLPFMKADFIDFLRHFRLDPDRYVILNQTTEGALRLTIKGPWLHTILFEVPLLASISALWNMDLRNHATDWGAAYMQGELKLLAKLRKWQGFKFADFGTRRRFGWKMQDYVVKTCKDKYGFVGTSNVELAMKYDVTPIGTMAHEWIMAGQAFVHPRDSQRFMLQKWADEYRGDLGYALTDTIGIDAFLCDLDKYFAKLYDGFRHDSGDPFEFVDKVVERLRELRVSTYEKQFIFSDGLDFKEAKRINEYCKARMLQCSFGIGTNLTNDTGRTPLNIVIKLTKVNGRDVAKISDSEGKTVCENDNYINYLKNTFTCGQEYDIVAKIKKENCKGD